MKVQIIKWSVIAVVVVSASSVAYALRSRWLPRMQQAVSRLLNPTADAKPSDDSHQGPTGSISLTARAKKNISLQTTVIEPSTFIKMVSMPALIVERPGRSQIEVTAPLGGRVTRVYPVQGAAVMPGDPLFNLRLTHEELVSAQSELLRSAEEVDVIKREIKRLNSISLPGAIAGKTIRQREYEQQKLEAVINAQRQSLELHGLSREQVDGIMKERKLLQDMTVVAPQLPADDHEGEPDHPFNVQHLAVNPGQYIDAGNKLCVLADHHELFIEGRAFEQDIELLQRVAEQGWDLTAMTFSGGQAKDPISKLKVFFLSDAVETNSRAFHFYVRLPNKMVRDVEAGGHRVVRWKYKPGPRMQINVPVEEWKNRVVLPVEAVAKDGVETYVFEQNGDHFDRVPVHVEYRDSASVVIESEARLLGSTIAANAAHDLQMALKKQASGGGDAHHGHVH